MKTDLENYIAYLYDYKKKQYDRILSPESLPQTFTDIYGYDSEEADMIYEIILKYAK